MSIHIVPTTYISIVSQYIQMEHVVIDLILPTQPNVYLQFTARAVRTELL
jgi:hypothetical protein